MISRVLLVAGLLGGTPVSFGQAPERLAMVRGELLDLIVTWGFATRRSVGVEVSDWAEAEREVEVAWKDGSPPQKRWQKSLEQVPDSPFIHRMAFC